MYHNGQEDGKLLPVTTIEDAHQALLFTEHDRRMAWKAISAAVMPLTLFERLHNQATLLDSHQAKFLVNLFLQTSRDASGKSSLGQVHYFEL